MQIYWWGILGLLGWSYGVCATLYFLIGSRFIGLAVAVFAFLILNVNEFIGGPDLQLVISASNYFTVMLGILSSVLYIYFRENNNTRTALYILICLAAFLIVFGFVTRPVWGISKIRATPSWATICAGISIILFLVMIVIADIRRYVTWAKPIAAGGSATLTCYFALYLAYSIIYVMDLSWPNTLSSGTLGLIKAFCFSLLVIQITALGVKFNIRLNV
jgi:predicted acyltransferase